jgi:hypothetical protein
MRGRLLVTSGPLRSPSPSSNPPPAPSPFRALPPHQRPVHPGLSPLLHHHLGGGVAPRHDRQDRQLWLHGARGKLGRWRARVLGGWDVFFFLCVLAGGGQRGRWTDAGGRVRKRCGWVARPAILPVTCLALSSLHHRLCAACASVPQVSRNQQYDAKADIFSLGMCMWVQAWPARRAVPFSPGCGRPSLFLCRRAKPQQSA